jgi:hypothetical protein
MQLYSPLGGLVTRYVAKRIVAARRASAGRDELFEFIDPFAEDVRRRLDGREQGRGSSRPGGHGSDQDFRPVGQRRLLVEKDNHPSPHHLPISLGHHTLPPQQRTLDTARNRDFTRKFRRLPGATSLQIWARKDVLQVLRLRFGDEAVTEFEAAVNRLENLNQEEVLHKLAMQSRRLSQFRKAFPKP